MKRLPGTTLTLVVAALVACVLWFAACRGLSRAGAAAGGAIAGSPMGPLGLAGGAAAGSFAGDALADALGADKEFTADEYRKILEDAGKELARAHKTIADLQAREPIRVPVEVPFIPTWVWRTLWIGAAFLVFRFRHGILAFVATASTGGFKAALLTLAGLVWGGKAADAAKVEVAKHEENTPRALALRRLRRIPAPFTPPATKVSQEQKPHDA